MLPYVLPPMEPAEETQELENPPRGFKPPGELQL